MPFGVISGVRQGTGVLDEGPGAPKEGCFGERVATRLFPNYFGISCFILLQRVFSFILRLRTA